MLKHSSTYEFADGCLVIANDDAIYNPYMTTMKIAMYPGCCNIIGALNACFQMGLIAALGSCWISRDNPAAKVGHFIAIALRWLAQSVRDWQGKIWQLGKPGLFILRCLGS